MVVLFALLPARQAAATAVIGGWLLLPPIKLDISGLPDFSKNMAATVGMMLGTLLFAPHRLLNFRPRWYDLPMALWCLCGILTSLQNGLGLYDGLSDALGQTILWGLPYLLGRLYFGDAEDLRYFVVAMVVAGLCYVPPCLWEARMSPQLLDRIYGISGWSGLRLGGYRPQVFFATGLECGLWMTAASLAAWWMWRCGALQRIGQVPFGPVLMPILLVTTALCRSAGALGLLMIGGTVLWLATRFRMRLLMALLILVAPLYISLRAKNMWSGQQAVDVAAAVFGPDRAQSLEYRFRCEKLIIAHALEQPIFGWGGWMRNMAYFGGRKDPRQRGHRRRAMDRLREQVRIRRADAVLPQPAPAGDPVRAALPGAVVGRPAAGGRLARRDPAVHVHDRLPAERLREHDLHHPGRRAHGAGAGAARGADRAPAWGRGRGAPGCRARDRGDPAP